LQEGQRQHIKDMTHSHNASIRSVHLVTGDILEKCDCHR